MKAAEKSLWAWLEKADYESGFSDDLDMGRIENLVAEGTPDVEGCYAGTSFLCELKSVDRPARVATGIKVGVNTFQAAALSRRHKAGGRAWILVQVGSGTTEARRYLLSGRHAHALKAQVCETFLCTMSIIGDGTGYSALDVVKAMCASAR